MKVLLLGGTDLTLAVAERIRVLDDVALAGVVHVGREFKISYSPDGVTNVRDGDLAAWCRDRGIATLEYSTMDDLAVFAREQDADVGLAAGWYHLVPRGVRDTFALGCLGLHASLLPKFRGGAPLNWTLLQGERESGVSLFILGDGVDDGLLLGQRRFAIEPRAVVADLVSLAERASVDLVTEVLPQLARGEATPVPQEGTPTYCLMRRPEDGRIDWRSSAAEIDRLVRAVGRPYPGARAHFGGEEIIVWRTELVPNETVLMGMPGQIARLGGEPDAIVVCGDGSVVVREATMPDGLDACSRLRRSANQHFDVS